MVQIVLTGASGDLGATLLAPLQQATGRGGRLICTYHKKPPPPTLDCTWVQWSLSHPDTLVGEVDVEEPIILLHLACTVSNRLHEVLQSDVQGTRRLYDCLAERMRAPFCFVFASSVEATSTSNYGLGKRVLEEYLRDQCTPPHRTLSIRVPRIRRVNSDAGMDRQAFAQTWLRLSGISSALAGPEMWHARFGLGESLDFEGQRCE